MDSVALDKAIGTVIQGSLTQGLEVRLHPDVWVEDMRVGKFLVVQGRRSRFFCMLTDVALGTANPRILANPPDPSNAFLQEVLAGSGTYGTVNLSPMLMFTPTPTEEAPAKWNGTSKKRSNLASFEANTNAVELLPVKTIPNHFSQVYDAGDRDFRSVFGWEDDPHRRKISAQDQVGDIGRPARDGVGPRQGRRPDGDPNDCAGRLEGAHQGVPRPLANARE